MRTLIIRLGSIQYLFYLPGSLLFPVAVHLPVHDLRIVYTVIRLPVQHPLPL